MQPTWLATSCGELATWGNCFSVTDEAVYAASRMASDPVSSHNALGDLPPMKSPSCCEKHVMVARILSFPKDFQANEQTLLRLSGAARAKLQQRGWHFLTFLARKDV